MNLKNYILEYVSSGRRKSDNLPPSRYFDDIIEWLGNNGIPFLEFGSLTDICCFFTSKKSTLVVSFPYETNGLQEHKAFFLHSDNSDIRKSETVDEIYIEDGMEKNDFYNIKKQNQFTKVFTRIYKCAKEWT